MPIFEFIVEQWNEFFFHKVDPVPLAMFRIAFGVLLCLNGLLMFYDWRTFLAPNAIVPPASNRGTVQKISLFRWLPESSATVFAVILVHCVSCFTLTIGCLFHVSAAIAWLTMISIHDRNRMILHSGDGVLRLVSFLIMFSPAGATLSVDGMFAGETADAERVSPWSFRLIQIQVAIIYLRSVYWKWKGPLWRDGSAIGFATRAVKYQRLRVPKILHVPIVLKSATWGTLVIEAGLGTLVWTDDWRLPMILLGVLLHLSIEVFMNVHLFGWTMMVCLFVFAC